MADQTGGGTGISGASSGEAEPRRSVVDRRVGLDRRRLGEADEQAVQDLDRRRGPGRRLSDFTRSAEEGELTREQFLFLMAIESFKKANACHYPTWSDVLEVVRLLGYRKTQAMEIRLSSAEDWREAADAPSNVRPERWASRVKPAA
jgi:hypothetical protein